MKGRNWIIWLTFLVALILDILPLPVWVQWLRPSWTLLVLIYWVMVMPYRVSVGYAFVLGLLIDLLQGSLLGLHVVALVAVTYFVAKLHRQFKAYPLRQQILMVLLLVFLYKLIIYAVLGFVGQLPHSLLYWLSIIISALLWPWVGLVLHDWRSRLHFER